MYVDYLTVMMVAVVAGAVLTIIYGLMFLEAPLADQRPWGWAFAVVGLLLGVTGLHLVLSWPLPGAYNIVMGELALYFGLLLLSTAFAIRAGELEFDDRCSRRCSRAPGRDVRALTQCIPHSDFSNTSQEPLMPISLA
jgi:hypothetical protein